MAIFYEYLYYNKLELDLFVRNIYRKRKGYFWGRYCIFILLPYHNNRKLLRNYLLAFEHIHRLPHQNSSQQ